MGMSASQARLLSITARINDVEFKSQCIANQKIRLSSESEQLAQDYTKALNKQKYQLTTYGANGAEKVDLTLNSLCQPDSRYQLKSVSGKQVLSKQSYNMYQTLITQSNNPESWGNRESMKNTKPCNNGDYFNDFMYAKYGKVSEMAERVFKADGKNYDWDIYKEPESSQYGYNKICQELGGNGGGLGTWQAIVNYATEHNLNVPGLPTLEEVNYYEKMFKDFVNSCDTQSASSSLNGDHTYTQLKTNNLDRFVEISAAASNDANWVYDAIASGEFYLYDTQLGKEVSPSETTNISPVSDTSDFAKEEAEYNAANMKINNKEKLLDNELKKLDTEHNALQTEHDSIKDLIGKNIEKSFNLFS